MTPEERAVPDAPDRRGPTQRPRPPSRWRPALLVLLVLVGAAAIGAALRQELTTGQVRVEIAAGTAERIDAGEAIELLPRTLEVTVGDRLEIVNDDDVTHEVGPYTVAPGQTLRQTFTTPGTLEGACTLHPSGAIAIVVR